MFIVEFFEHNFFTVVGGLFTLITLIAFFIPRVRHFVILLYRIIKGFYNRKVAIFANADEFNNLKNVLLDTDLFHEKNIIQIDEKSISKAEDSTIYLVDFSSFHEQLNEILRLKKDKTALIVYAPNKDISKDKFEEISNLRNTTITNFRGRLTNDIVSFMMTTPNK